MDILRICAQYRWRYHAPTAVLTEPMDWEGALLVVVGDPTAESFEWLYYKDSRVIARSDHGYTSVQGAFRDGALAQIHPRS
jgi:hypothetical protein